MSFGIARKIFALAGPEGRIEIHANGSKIPLSELSAPGEPSSNGFYAGNPKPVITVTGSKAPMNKALQQQAKAIKAVYSREKGQHSLSLENVSSKDVALILLHLKHEEARKAEDSRAMTAWEDEISRAHGRDHKH